MLGLQSVAPQRPSTYGIPHLISIVIPVYQGELTLGPLLDEIEPFVTESRTPDGHAFRVTEVILVFDDGPDASAQTLRDLARNREHVRAVWLSRNFGQHAATLAGIASSGGDWIVTMDEDGQHDPRFIAALLDVAMSEQSAVVYAKPTNAPPHGLLRNTASKMAKWTLTKFVSRPEAGDYQSYRLILGAVGRSVAAFSGAGVYLDVAIGWVAGRARVAPVELRQGGRPSGYSVRRLFAHFLRMVLTSGTRGLRFVSALGIVFAFGGLVLAVVILIARLTGSVETQGWASTVVVVLLGFGATLVSLGIIAEYIGVSVNMAMGKPPYVIMSDPALGPLGRVREPGK